jgi:hypothetical protein
VLLLFSCSNQPGVEKKLPSVFEKIKDKHILCYDLKELLRNLDTTVAEDKEFWLSIINDTNYVTMQRGACVLKLFERFARPGSKLNDIGPVFTSNYPGLLLQGPADTALRKRRIFPRSGGSWKDVGFYLRGGDAISMDSLTSLARFVAEKKGKLFTISVYSTYLNDVKASTCNQCHERDYLALHIALSGNMTKEQLKEFLYSGKSAGLEDITVLGVYPEWGTPSKNKSEDDL